jgi:uncharacterized protein involved in exopolysaccharide biosynthesis
VLQTLVPNESYRSSELAFGDDPARSLDFSRYIDILKRRIFYFLLPFGLISILGLYMAAIKKPSYLSEGKILVESQRIAPDLVRPIVTATASERIQLIEQRILTKDNLLSVARKFGLFADLPRVPELMLASVQIRPIAQEGQPRQGTSTIAFTVGFEYGNPELAMRVASEFITLILDEDARSRTSRTAETVKLLTAEAKDIEDKLEATQSQLLEVARRPRDSVTEAPEKEKSQLAALAALKAELIQKTSVYSEAHPAVTALKKRIAAMEKSLMQSPQATEKARSTQEEEIDALKRQREVLEKRLADANAKLAVARLGERLDRDQQSERLQVLESPSLPQYPEKSGRLKTIGTALALAVALGIGAVIATEWLDGSIRSRQDLAGVVDSHLIVSIPYMITRSDIVRARLRKMFVALAVLTILVAWSGLVAAIVFHLPVDFPWSDKTVAFSGPKQ